MERFHRRATEIQVLLQSSEPPLELQVQHEIQFSVTDTHNTFSFWCLATGGYGLLCEAQNHLNILSVVDQIE